jgi:hexokinase
MDLKNDKRIVLTLDAGGTNFRFSAIRGGKPVTETVVSHGRNSRDCYTPKREKGSLWSLTANRHWNIATGHHRSRGHRSLCLRFASNEFAVLKGICILSLFYQIAVRIITGVAEVQ